MVELKFCGLTRASDAATAVQVGASYCGVVFAGGPRVVTPEQARAVFAAVTGTRVGRVGVFGPQGADEIAQIASGVPLDVVQLHGGAPRALLIALRQRGMQRVWPVVHLSPDQAAVSEDVASLFAAGADAVVLDAAVGGKLGGTGVALDWAALAPHIARLRQHGQVVLAGGLRPENVARAVAVAAPDIVDVSSGVEVAPGVKDPERMRVFADAARRGEVQ